VTETGVIPQHCMDRSYGWIYIIQTSDFASHFFPDSCCCCCCCCCLFGSLCKSSILRPQKVTSTVLLCTSRGSKNTMTPRFLHDHNHIHISITISIALGSAVPSLSTYIYYIVASRALLPDIYYQLSCDIELPPALNGID
jgi:hypothetical protein